MAIRPDDAANLAKGVREIFVEAESILLEKIARALARGLDSPDWAEEKLLGVQHLLREVDRALLDINKGVPGAVERAVSLAYNRGIASAGGDLKEAGLVYGAFGEVQNTGAVSTIVSEVMERLTPMSFQIRRAVADIYQQTVTQTAAQVNTGVLTRREASRRTLDKLARNGVSGFKDRSGRMWEMGAYAEQSVRTASMNAALQGHVDRVSELGVDTMIVSNAPEECKLCRPFEGRVLSVSGKTTGRLSDGKTVVASLAEAKRAGLFHNNCRHSISIYLPGITKAKTDTADPKGDALRQQQRGYERSIREGKRKVIIAKEIGGPNSQSYREERRKLTELQGEFKDWRDANDRKDLGYRTNLRTR
jgi:hypothetical protein